MTGDEIIEMLDKNPEYHIEKKDGKYIVTIGNVKTIAGTLEEAACHSDMIVVCEVK